MSLDKHTVFRKLPSMIGNYVNVVTSAKPYIAPDGALMGKTDFEALEVKPRMSHIQRYRNVCAIPESPYLPHAFPHVLAMPLHMYIFAAPGFPVKVLGLIHLRNTIRTLEPIEARSTLRLRAYWETLRESPGGQEYDLITQAYIKDRLVWEEVSTMLARRATPGQRPVIERAGDAEIKRTFNVPANTGRRYARVSGDYNPIHLSARTAGWFGFKQAVAHGMWSMSRCLGEGASQLPNAPMQIDTYFKLPLYLPSDVIFRAQRSDMQTHLSLSSAKGDRLHLTMQMRAL